MLCGGKAKTDVPGIGGPSIPFICFGEDHSRVSLSIILKPGRGSLQFIIVRDRDLERLGLQPLQAVESPTEAVPVVVRRDDDIDLVRIDPLGAEGCLRTVRTWNLVGGGHNSALGFVRADALRSACLEK